MEIFWGLENFKQLENAVVTMGTFDGVHLGHQEIIKDLVKTSKTNQAKSVLITFDPHPRKVLQPDIPLQLIQSVEEKNLVLQTTGIDYLIIIPFDKQFFAGGSSGIRAWQARTLGPGNYNRASLANDTVRTNLRNLDQLGDIKFEGNIEYRFKLLDNFWGAKVKGATFVDFGNTWLLRQNNLQQGGEFKFNEIYNQTAIGVGLGLRFDVSFFVFRLDAGFKFKDPQFIGDEQYVYKYWFDKSEKKAFQADYAIRNSPDRYSLSQIQFGIGLPF